MKFLYFAFKFLDFKLVTSKSIIFHCDKVALINNGENDKLGIDQEFG